ncbi:MAG: energy transducer TonB [Flavobacteriaceae bacterium]|nr:energy transducer TonB [Flavobacteriaceae bacterium]
MSVFNFNLNQHNKLASESYYEVEPEKELTEEEAKILEALEKLNNTKAETNKAYNETVKEKSFSEAYKPIAPPEDYVKPEFNQPQEASDESASNNNEISDLNHEEISSFSKVKSILDNRTKKKEAPASSNRKSTIRYSLVDRTDDYLPIPIYLCEDGGTIVINITVNDQGKVIDTYVNNSSTSTNECLIESALEYAKQAKFNASPGKKPQLGSITFNFVSKY